MQGQSDRISDLRDEVLRKSFFHPARLNLILFDPLEASAVMTLSAARGIVRVNGLAGRNRISEAVRCVSEQVNLIVDMPDRLSDLLFRVLQQNGGRLSRRGRQNEFTALTDDEVARVEAIYLEVFSGDDGRT